MLFETIAYFFKYCVLMYSLDKYLTSPSVMSMRLMSGFSGHLRNLN